MRTSVSHISYFLLTSLFSASVFSGCSTEAEEKCTPGATRTESCGPSLIGTATFLCGDDQKWSTGECILPPPACQGDDCGPVILCEDGDHRIVACLDKEGIQSQLCNEGTWEDFGECVESCTEDEVRQIPCGVNGSAEQTLRCTDGEWRADYACVDPDECRNNDRITADCTRSDIATMDGLCLDGKWQWEPCEVISMDGSDTDTDTLTTSAFCAVRNSGRVVCWGDNSQGILGSGTSTQIPRAIMVPGVDNAVQVAVGARHACALHANNTVTCWGNNRYGQLGVPASTTISGPVDTGIDDAIAISAGTDFTCYLNGEGDVRCFGQNNNKQLAHPTLTSTHTPTLVNNLTNVVSITSGGGSTCATLENGQLFCWGENANGQLGLGAGTVVATPTRLGQAFTRIGKISLGSTHSCGVFDDQVYCWGTNSAGQLGITGGSTNTISNAININKKFVHAAAGIGGGCAVDIETKAIYCWGSNMNGIRGTGSDATMNGESITKVADIDHAIEVHTSDALLSRTTCAVDWEGSVYCWGYTGNNASGQPFDANYRNIPVHVDLAIQE